MFPRPKEFPVPPKVMECKEWHNIQEKVMKEKIKKEEQMAEEMVDGEEKDCQLGLIEYMKNIRYCKDDCLFCQSLSNKKDGNKPYKYTCAGKEDMKEIKDYPQNTCKDWVQGDFPSYSCDSTGSTVNISTDSTVNISITPISRFEIFKQQGPEGGPPGGKICTCSTDSCDPTQSGDNTDPSNTDPNSSNANNTSQDSNHASRRIILNYLLTLGVFIAFRFSF